MDLLCECYLDAHHLVEGSEAVELVAALVAELVAELGVADYLAFVGDYFAFAAY